MPVTQGVPVEHRERSTGGEERGAKGGWVGVAGGRKGARKAPAPLPARGRRAAQSCGLQISA
jgi:hypothetical protein